MSAREPIALIGMACRLPGADSPTELWAAMTEGRHNVAKLGPRWWSGTLDAIDEFDAEFFGIRERDARLMDPQQRMLLEVVYEAIEDAGLAIGSLAATETGVFVGQHRSEFAHLLRDHARDDALAAVTGTAGGVTSGRISAAFDLFGPSITVDTACSSSLVALHLAVRSLRAGECEQAIVAGVNLVLLPAMHDAFAAAGMTAGDGRCKFGDERADGFVRSDGIAAVVLRPLRAAGGHEGAEQVDRVRAVVRGTAVGNTGRGEGHLLTPSSAAQERLVRTALRDADLDPADVDYIEAHGTGTSAGDAAEFTALEAVFGGRSPDRPCLLGSAKSTIGHTESAAGLVGLIRATMCLERGTVPPNRHLGTRNALLTRPGASIALHHEASPLPRRGRPVVAGVNSFGATGTGAHVLLESAPVPAPVPPSASAHDAAADAPREPDPVLLVLSARSAAAAGELARRYRAHLLADGDATLADVAVAAARRDQYEHRVAVTGRTHAEVAARLDDAADDRTGSGTWRAGPVAIQGRTAFVFSGYGAQWRGMGRELLATDAGFAATLARCDEAVRAVAGWSVLDELHDDSGQHLGIEYTQPLLWAMQVGLAGMWRDWGVEPDVVLGHSMGEVAAAHVAGALDLTDAAAVICHRSRLSATLRGRGAMLLAALSPRQAAERIACHAGRAFVAAHNGPETVVLSGAVDALGDIAATLERDDVFHRWIDIDVAAHTPQMSEVADELGIELAGIRPRSGDVPLHSTVLDRVVDGAALDPRYWVANLCEPVRFATALRGVLDAQAGPAADLAIVEIAPHPVLRPAIDDVVAARGGGAFSVGSLRRHRPERAEMLAAHARLFVGGRRVAVTGVATGGSGRHVGLPSYPWQRTSYWPEAPVPTPQQLRPSAAARSLKGVGLSRRTGSAPRSFDLIHRSGTTAGQTAPGHRDPLEQRVARRLAEAACCTVAEVLARPAEEVLMDSLVSAELRVALHRDFHILLPVPVILRDTSLRGIVEAVRCAGDAIGHPDGMPPVTMSVAGE